jgi:2-polyprenyl-6-methoxyphenol hydroxylase-like FAD-dependent oxidoreductase
MNAVLNRPADVLIVGAGPTGLVLALWLKRLGIDVRIIDKTREPGTTSRALAVHARTLELYDQMGIAVDLVERGLPFAGVNVWVRGKLAGHANFGDVGKGLSPFPYILMFPQDQHEKLLIERLRDVGVEVERLTTLATFEQRGDQTIAHLERSDGAEATCPFAYVAGCDGSRSRVREVLDIGYPGGTYERIFYVADVELHGKLANHELHVALDEADLLAVFPMRGDNTVRLIGTVRPESEEHHEKLTWSDVSSRAIEHLQMTVDRVNWFSTYKVHHRVAEHFQRGRAFLVGDAAHVHSPVGGQGMNTGIGDAVNLAWKLAAVIRRHVDEELLSSYEIERMAFAKRLVNTTDRAFTFVTRDGPLARRVRLGVVPRLLPALMDRTAVRRFFFRTVSQTLLHYRHSALCDGKAGAVHGGDRLPWVQPEDGATVDNFAPLRSLDWQVHVYGAVSPEFATACTERGLPLHSFPWNSRAKDAKLAPNAAYLVRPDGYVALADPAPRPDRLKGYLDAHGIPRSMSQERL